MTKEKLLNELILHNYLKSPDIIAAFQNIDRINFVPENLKGSAYVNSALPIGFGQTISQPLTVAIMLELLSPKTGDKILDVGSGSGWTTAMLSHLTGPKGKVIGIEQSPELVQLGAQNIKKYKGRKKYPVILRGDGKIGHELESPYDKILVSAAVSQIPTHWKNQLKIGGRLVAPVLDSLVLLEKKSDKDFEKKEFFGFCFLPLKDI